MAWLLFPLMGGIAVAELTHIPFHAIPFLIAAAGALLLAAVVVGISKLRTGGNVRLRVFIALIVALMIVVGMASDMVHRESGNTEWPTGKREWSGVVNEVPQPTAKTWRVSVVVDYNGVARKVMLSVLKKAEAIPPQVGKAVCFLAEIKQPYNYYSKDTKGNNAVFDYAKWIKRQGYSGQAFVPTGVRPVSAAKTHTLKESLPMWQKMRIRALTLRSRLLSKYKSLNLSTEDAAVLAALTLGDRSAVSKATREKYSLSGASHVLALSGLHLGILMTFLLLLLRPMRLRLWSRWLMTFICILLAWSFVMLTGCSISIVRSALMLSLMLLLGMRGEGVASLNNVTVAAFVILVFSPQSLMDVGFQLSFLSVFFIIYFLPYYHESVLMRVPHWSWILFHFLYVTIVAQLASAPVVACVFGRVPLLFLVTNVLVIPCAYLLLIGAMCFFVLSWSDAMAGAVGWVMARVVELMNGGLTWISSLPAASVEIHLSLPVALCLYPFMLTLFTWLYFRRRIYAYWTLFLLGALISFSV